MYRNINPHKTWLTKYKYIHVIDEGIDKKKFRKAGDRDVLELMHASLWEPIVHVSPNFVCSVIT